MKISASSLAQASVYEKDRLDLSSTHVSRASSIAPVTAFESGPSPGTPSVEVDQVTISSSAREYCRFNYTATQTARSVVTIKDTGDTVTHDQKTAVEQLVGKLIKKAQLQAAFPGRGEAGSASASNRVSPGWQMEVSRSTVHYETARMNFDSAGSVTTEDGRSIDFSLSMEMARSFVHEEYRADRITVIRETVALTDPLVINLSGRAPELTDMTFAFDLDCDGRMEQVSFLRSGSGFLSFDKNNDNQINDGSELFGPVTGNGFEELTSYDQDANGWIDENDDIFSRLSVWTRDGEGNDVMISLKDAGIGAVSLYGSSGEFDITGPDNSLKGRVRSNGIFLFEDGRAGSIQQVDLASRQLSHTPDTAGDSGRPAPLEQSMAVREGIMTGNQEKIMAARQRLPRSSQTASAPLETRENRFKDLMEMVEKMKKEFEKIMNISTGPHKRQDSR